MDCRCNNWCRDNSKIGTQHHPKCPDYDPEGDAKKIINDLLTGIIQWAADEDGAVHPELWDAFESAAYFVYRGGIIDDREPE